MQIICLMLFRQHAFLLREKLCFCLEKLSVFLCFFLEHARCPTGERSSTNEGTTTEGIKSQRHQWSKVTLTLSSCSYTSRILWYSYSGTVVL